LTLPLRDTPRGLLLYVKATPKAAKNDIVGIRNGAVVVKVTAAPEKGKANSAVIALLAEHIGVPKSALELVSGDTDRNKVVRIASYFEVVQTWVRGLELR
jgi:uncharacterized protein